MLLGFLGQKLWLGSWTKLQRAPKRQQRCWWQLRHIFLRRVGWCITSSSIPCAKKQLQPYTQYPPSAKLRHSYNLRFVPACAKHSSLISLIKLQLLFPVQHPLELAPPHTRPPLSRPITTPRAFDQHSFRGLLKMGAFGCRSLFKKQNLFDVSKVVNVGDGYQGLRKGDEG